MCCERGRLAEGPRLLPWSRVMRPMARAARCSVAALILVAGVAAGQSEPEVRGAWIRGTVAGQSSTGAFMDITSAQDSTLVSAATPVARVAEVHQMAMVGDVMKMTPVPRLALPAGKTVELKPGGYHVMLMDLKRPLKTGEHVPLQLIFEGPDKQRRVVDVQAEVVDVAAQGPSTR